MDVRLFKKPEFGISIVELNNSALTVLDVKVVSPFKFKENYQPSYRPRVLRFRMSTLFKSLFIVQHILYFKCRLIF